MSRENLAIQESMPESPVSPPAKGGEIVRFPMEKVRITKVAEGGYKSSSRNERLKDRSYPSRLDDVLHAYILTLDHELLTPEEEINLAQKISRRHLADNLLTDIKNNEFGQSREFTIGRNGVAPVTKSLALRMLDEAGLADKVSLSYEDAEEGERLSEEQKDGRRAVIGYSWNKKVGMHVANFQTRQKLSGYVKVADDAKQKFIESNRRFVLHIAKRFHDQNMELTDLMQEGIFGLIRGVEKFDWREGNRFSSYSGRCISDSIRKAVDKNYRDNGMVWGASNKITRMRSVETMLSQDLGRTPTVQEVAFHMGTREEDVLGLRFVAEIGTPRSLDERIRRENEKTKLGDVIADPRMDTQRSAIENIAQQDSQATEKPEIANEKIRAALESEEITDSESNLIYSHFFEAVDISAIAERQGVSENAVDCKLRRILGNMRIVLEGGKVRNANPYPPTTSITPDELQQVLPQLDLTSRELEVIGVRFGLTDDSGIKSLKKTGKVVGLSGPRVSQIEHKMLAQIEALQPA